MEYSCARCFGYIDPEVAPFGVLVNFVDLDFHVADCTREARNVICEGRVADEV